MYIYIYTHIDPLVTNDGMVVLINDVTNCNFFHAIWKYIYIYIY